MKRCWNGDFSAQSTCSSKPGLLRECWQCVHERVCMCVSFMSKHVLGPNVAVSHYLKQPLDWLRSCCKFNSHVRALLRYESGLLRRALWFQLQGAKSVLWTSFACIRFDPMISCVCMMSQVDRTQEGEHPPLRKCRSWHFFPSSTSNFHWQTRGRLSFSSPTIPHFQILSFSGWSHSKDSDVGFQENILLLRVVPVLGALASKPQISRMSQEEGSDFSPSYFRTFYWKRVICSCVWVNRTIFILILLESDSSIL